MQKDAIKTLFGRGGGGGTVENIRQSCTSKERNIKFLAQYCLQLTMIKYLVVGTKL